jgi:predicted nucleic acid-binding protein
MYSRIFLDANVLVDIYDETRPFCIESRKAIQHALLQEEAELYTSCDILTTLYYLYAKQDRSKALDHITEVNKWCQVVPINNTEVTQSCSLMKHDSRFSDLEDTLQYIMAKKIDADLILSNDRQFTSDEITLMTTERFCREMGL